MYKKLLVGLGVLAALVFSFNICFATNDGKGLQDAANGVRNAVGGAENAIENAANNISGKSKEATNSMENGAGNATNSTHNTATQNNNKTAVTGTTNNTGYTATRTATGNATFMGMNATAWTWLVIGIAAIAIVALVWYYSTQVTSNRDHDKLD